MWWIKNKTLVRESGLLEGGCDYHCHLLPGVDDGVKEMEETLEILEIWEQAGLKEVWLTPHIMEDIPNKPAELKAKAEELRKAYNGPIQLHLAAEHMMDGLMMKRMEEDELMPYINGNGNDNKNQNENGMLLVETSYYIPPMNMEEFINRIKKKGYDPVLAHPERYQYMGANDYKRWKNEGVLLQLNLPSVVGAYGPEVQRKAEWLLNQGMYDLCGTDTHSINHVDYFMNSSINKKIERKIRPLLTSMRPLLTSPV